METNFERLDRLSKEGKLITLDEVLYLIWIKTNSPESPYYSRKIKQDAQWFLDCALVNIALGRDIYGDNVNL